MHDPSDMTLLVISPDFASHYEPLAVLAGAAARRGHRVIVATGDAMRPRVEGDGFEWRPVRLGRDANDGVAAPDDGIVRFIDATRDGALAALQHQAAERARDLLWEPERVALDIAAVLDEIEPDQTLVDHVSFGSTLGVHASGRPFVTVVPGHPSQLPVGTERYGVPARWPAPFTPDPGQLAELEHLADTAGAAFTARWNAALGRVAPGRPPVDDAMRVHGRRVLYNSDPALLADDRRASMHHEHRFVGPLVRQEDLPAEQSSWLRRCADRPQVYVALGTFLSLRTDVLAGIAEALRRAEVRAAIAIGDMPVCRLGPVPDDWIVARRLPQVAMLGAADLAIHHGGNNSVQECLHAGVRQVLLPFSTDQFALAADLARTGRAEVASPNDLVPDDFAAQVMGWLATPAPEPIPLRTTDALVDAVFG